MCNQSNIVRKYIQRQFKSVYECVYLELATVTWLYNFSNDMSVQKQTDFLTLMTAVIFLTIIVNLSFV